MEPIVFLTRPLEKIDAMRYKHLENVEVFFKRPLGVRMFEVGDYAVCPGHGVGQVTDIETKDVAGETMSFYIVKIISNGMTVMVPTNSQNGIRSLVLKGKQCYLRILIT